eukprot:3919410-Prorocentrum_lima.AAC.1
MSEKRRHPELVHTRKWWMQRYLKMQDMLQEENFIKRIKVPFSEDDIPHQHRSIPSWLSQWKGTSTGSR